MTTSPTATVPAATPEENGPLRLALASRLPSRGPVDGAWWPRSRDLQAEACDLVDHFPQLVGRIERLHFSRPDWDVVDGAPSQHRVRAARGPVKTSSSAYDDTHLVVVKLSSGNRMRLLVLPSDTDADVAARAMAQAVDPTNTQAPRTLLGLG